jgi:hypothetical protein
MASPRMSKALGKTSTDSAFVNGFKEAAGWEAPKPRQPHAEVPLPDYAPFAVPSDEAWRELQRRRHLVRVVENLAHSARDEGYPLSSRLLIFAGRPHEPSRKASQLSPAPTATPRIRKPRTHRDQDHAIPPTLSKLRDLSHSIADRKASEASPDNPVEAALAALAALGQPLKDVKSRSRKRI